MAELNDYCATVREALRHKHDRRAAARRYLKGDDGLLIGYFPQVSYEEADDKTKMILPWQWFQPVVTNVISLIMLRAFVEKQPRSLA